MRAFAVPLLLPLSPSVPADDQLKCCGKRDRAGGKTGMTVAYRKSGVAQ